jgi:flagellar biosynthesis protein FliR
MPWLQLLDVDKFLLFTLVLTRVSGLLMTAPVYGTKDVPVTVRALLSFALAVLLMPTQWNVPLEHPGTMLQYLVLVGCELVVGVFLGMGITILLSGIQLAGELMSRIGGLAMSDIFDPTLDTEVPLFSRLMGLVSTAVFLGIGGHRLLMSGLLDTFSSIPPGGFLAAVFEQAQSAAPAGNAWLQSLLETFVLLISESFQLGIRASIPVVTAVLLATLVLGLISRTLPQLNVLVVGFGVNSMLTFAILSVTLGTGVLIFSGQIEPTIETILRNFHVSLHAAH